MPVGSLYVRKIKNLTAAGRCIPVGDKETRDIMRVIFVYADTGEAAGIIAALYQNNDKIQVKTVQNQPVSCEIKIHIDDCYN